MIRDEKAAQIPDAVLASPALLFLHYRIEQILGIRASSDALVKLNDYIEKRCGYPFVENPAAYEHVLASREQIFDASKIVTVNETYFFREGAHFELLARNFLPDLVAKLNRPLQICSAATSIGCEAYSIAMLLDYHSKNGPRRFEFEIDAFDICADVIEAARSGHYTANAIRVDGSEWRHIMDLHLTPSGPDYLVSKEIRGKVRFFPHNIMRGFERQYDVIFFRNALIYFSSKNRLFVMNNLADALFDGGLLFLGVSETFAAKHPLLAHRHLSDVFYFQKISSSAHFSSNAHFAASAKPAQKPDLQGARSLPAFAAKKPAERKPASARQAPSPQPAELKARGEEIAAILETEEGRPNALKILEMISGEKDGGIAASPQGSALAASIAYFLGAQDYGAADVVLSHMEKRGGGACALFLRGEYHLLMDNAVEAMRCFERAAGKEKSFWPAFYRIASLSAEGDSARHEYKIKKACESLALGGELGYECFMGGFSPDYFRRILERKLPAGIDGQGSRVET